MHISSTHIRNAVLGLCIVLGLSGCNLFTTMHSDGKESNSHVLVADGKAAMSRGDYVKAAEYFRLGMEHNPRDSEARVGYTEAYLKAQGFSLGAFFDSLMSGMDSDGGDDIEFIVPAAWGVDTIAEVEAMLVEVIAALDPIALGQTEGPYKATDLNVNLNVGVFYAMKVSAQMQNLGGTFELQNFNIDENDIITDADGTSVTTWALPSTTLVGLEEAFLWIADANNLQPALSFITGIQSDISAAVIRLNAATATMENEDVAEMINSLTEMFGEWEVLAYQ
jgi:hypothetical protein